MVYMVFGVCSTHSTQYSMWLCFVRLCSVCRMCAAHEQTDQYIICSYLCIARCRNAALFFCCFFFGTDKCLNIATMCGISMNKCLSVITLKRLLRIFVQYFVFLWIYGSKLVNQCWIFRYLRDFVSNCMNWFPTQSQLWLSVFFSSFSLLFYIVRVLECMRKFIHSWRHKSSQPFSNCIKT